MGKNVRTTISIPEELLEATDRVVREGKAKSRNEFFSVALRHELAALERSRIDEAFRGMANDPYYREEAEGLAGEFDRASWEAFEFTDNGGEDG